MPTVVERAGGRPPLIALADIISAGRDIGMRDLSVHAVAAKLNVSTTALYRHIQGRWELERLVGESLLGELDLPDDPDPRIERHLLSFGLRLVDYTDAHPGLATYLQVLFPRGKAGAMLLAAEVAALGRRGYSTDAAMVLSSAVATLAISLAAREDRNAVAIDSGGGASDFEIERGAADDRLAGDVQLGPAHQGLPRIESRQYVRLLLSASIRGLVSAIPPGRAVDDVIAELASAGEDS